MIVRDVPRHEWPAFLARFSREHRAWLATIHGIEGGMPITRIPSGPIQTVRLVREFPDDTLRLTLVNGVSLCAPRPAALRVQQTDSGIECALEIETLDGAFIRLAFRAAARPDQLDGVVPAEVAGDSPIASP